MTSRVLFAGCDVPFLRLDMGLRALAGLDVASLDLGREEVAADDRIVCS